MDPITLTPMELSLGLLVAALLGGLAGYLLRRLGERRLAPGARSSVDRLAGDVRPGGEAYGSYPGLRRAERPMGPADPWRAELPADVEAAARSGNERKAPTVLVVDDRLELRAVHSTYLQQHGYNVLLAADGEAALEIVRERKPSVVVLDHSLPGLTGIEVTRELKGDPRTARIPVILITAHSYGAIGVAARQAGVAAFLPKPVDPSRVLREVERHTRADAREA